MTLTPPEQPPAQVVEALTPVHEQQAWEWLEKLTSENKGEHPNDVAFSADEMVDAFMAGIQSRALTAPESVDKPEPPAQVVKGMPPEYYVDEADDGKGGSWILYSRAVNAVRAALATQSASKPEPSAAGLVGELKGIIINLVGAFKAHCENVDEYLDPEDQADFDHWETEAFRILTALTRDSKAEGLLREMVDIADHHLTDVEVEAALASEGWRPDGERFERMFAVVMKSRATRIDQHIKERDNG